MPERIGSGTASPVAGEGKRRQPGPRPNASPASTGDSAAFPVCRSAAAWSLPAAGGHIYCCSQDCQARFLDPSRTLPADAEQAHCTLRESTPEADFERLRGR